MSIKKRSEKQKVKLTEEDFLQGMDHSYVLLNCYYNTMITCKVIHIPEVADAFSKAGDAMTEVYQVIGKYWGEHNEQT